jgi:hypothetical protein
MGLRDVLSMVRVSGKAQIDRTGIPRQLENIATICTEHNLTVAEADEYRYPALSGADVEKNPKFRAMLGRLEEPNIAGIVVSDISRLFRPEFADNLGMSKPFRVNGKLIFYEDGVLDLRKDRDIGVFIQLAMEAGAHRKRIIKNTQWGRNERRKHGDCKTDPLPAGVKFVPHPKTDPNELVTGHFEYSHDFKSDRVAAAYSRIAAGESQAVVARDLKFASPTKLRQTLRSRWWIGEKHSAYKREGAFMRDDGTKYDGKRIPRGHKPIKANFNEPPLISLALWDKVQAILDNRHKTWVQVKAKTNPQIEACLGHGLLYCQCGMKMYPKKGLGAAKTSVMYYMCSSHANGKTPCGRPMVRQEFVDGEIRFFVIMRLVDRAYLKTLAPAQPKDNTEAINKRLTQLEKKLEKQMRQIGEVDDDSLLMRIIKDTEKDISEQKRQLRSQPTPVTFDVDTIRKHYLRFRELDLAEQKSLIRSTFAKIQVDTKGSIIQSGLVWC